MAGVAGLALEVNTGGVCLHRAWQFVPTFPTAPFFVKPSLRRPVAGARVTMMYTSKAINSELNSVENRAGMRQDSDNALTRALQRCAVSLATAVAIALPFLPLPTGIAIEAPTEPTSLVEAPTPIKDASTLLRDALPIHNAVIRDVQNSIEGISDCLNLPPKEASSSIALSTWNASLVLEQNKDNILAEIMDPDRVMGRLLVDELSVGVIECNKFAEDNNLAAIAAKQKDLLQIVSKLEEFMVNKFPFEIPEEYANRPLLKGRATIEMKLRLKERPNVNGNGKGNGNGKSTIIKIVVDGYSAPVTAGNFVDLVARHFYDGMAIRKADGYIVQTGDPPGTADGFVDPGTGKVRTIPLEIMVEGDNAPIYGATLEDLGRDKDKTKLPFNSCSTLAMARKDNDKNSASSQIFWLLKDCQEKSNSESKRAEESNVTPVTTNSTDPNQENASKEVELKVKGSVEDFFSANEMSTDGLNVDYMKETITKEIVITKSIIDGFSNKEKAAGTKAEIASTESAEQSQGEARGADSPLQEPGACVDSGDLQESEIIKVDNSKCSNESAKNGQYAVFGYVVENQDLLGKLQVGDVIEAMRIVSGIDNLVNPSYRI